MLQEMLSDEGLGVTQEEKEVLEDLHNAGRSRGIPKLHSSGSVTVGDHTHHYIVMQRLGSNLDTLIRQKKIGSGNFVQVCQVQMHSDHCELLLADLQKHLILVH